MYFLLTIGISHWKDQVDEKMKHPFLRALTHEKDGQLWKVLEMICSCFKVISHFNEMINYEPLLLKRSIIPKIRTLHTNLLILNCFTVSCRIIRGIWFSAQKFFARLPDMAFALFHSLLPLLISAAIWSTHVFLAINKLIIP